VILWKQIRKKNKSLKGFTLVELIIVLGIIGVLAGLATMNMVRWIGETRTTTACADSKLLFNASQTVVQNLSLTRQDKINLNPSGAADYKGVLENCLVLYSNRTLSIAYLNGADPTQSADWLILDDASYPEVIPLKARLLRDIVGYYGDSREFTWVFSVEGYMVQTASVSESPNWRYVGQYPQKIQYNQLNGNLLARWGLSSAFTTAEVATAYKRLSEQRDKYDIRKNPPTI